MRAAAIVLSRNRGSGNGVGFSAARVAEEDAATGQPGVNARA